MPSGAVSVTATLTAIADEAVQGTVTSLVDVMVTIEPSVSLISTNFEVLSDINQRVSLATSHLNVTVEDNDIGKELFTICNSRDLNSKLGN